MPRHRGSVCFINNYFPNLSEPFIYREVLGLRRRGIQIKTFSIRKPGLTELSKESHDLRETTTYLLPVDTRKFVGAHARFLARKPLAYLHLLFFLLTRKYDRGLKDRARTFFHFCEGVYLARLIQEDTSITHIHAHYASHPATLAFVASVLTGIPFTFTAHAYDIWEDRLFVREKAAMARLVITCSLYGRQSLLKMNGVMDPNKVITVYHGVDTRRFQPRNGQREQKNGSPWTILNVGRLCKDKGQDQLIRACRMLKDEGYSFVCKIVGEGPLRFYLEGLISENRLEGTVVLCGKAFQEEILGFYQEADLFVLSSVQENLPNVLLESLSAGVPVIATRLAGTPELIQDGSTGILVEPGNANELARAMRRVMDDPALARLLATKGREWVRENFDVEKSLDKLHGVYHTILNQAVSPQKGMGTGSGAAGVIRPEGGTGR